MAEEWKVGDVVMLKSGGPKMTIVNTDKNSSGQPTVACIWFCGPDHSKTNVGNFLGAVVEQGR